MTRPRRRRAWLLVLLLVGAAGLVPLLRANEARQQASWENSCLSSGGSVWSVPAAQDNPMVVQLRRPAYECRSTAGVLVSARD